MHDHEDVRTPWRISRLSLLRRSRVEAPTPMARVSIVGEQPNNPWTSKACWAIAVIAILGILIASGLGIREVGRRRYRYQGLAALHDKAERASRAIEETFRRLEVKSRSIEERARKLSPATKNLRPSEAAVVCADDPTTMAELLDLAQATDDRPLAEVASAYSTEADDAARQAGQAAEAAQFHGRMKRKYQHAASRPWEADPADSVSPR